MSNRMPLEGVSIGKADIEILMAPAAPGPFYPPTKGYKDDAGWDLTVSTFITVGPKMRVRLQHNLRVAIPYPYYGLIIPRSSTLQNHGLIVVPGLIDSGFRGEVMTVVFNTSESIVNVQEGARVSQLLILKHHEVSWRKIEPPTPDPNKPGEAWPDLLPASERGQSGFGSTNTVRKGGGNRG